MSEQRPSKRPREEQASEAAHVTSIDGINPDQLDDLRAACIRRDVLVRWAKSDSFEKLVRSKFVRIASAGGVEELRQVTGVEAASEPYTVDFVASSRDIAEGDWVGDPSFVRLEKKSGTVPPPAPPGYDTFRVITRVKLKLAAGRGAATAVRLSVVSNSPPTTDELRRLAALLPPSSSSSSSSSSHPSQTRVELSRMLGEAVAGFARAVRQGGTGGDGGAGARCGHGAEGVRLWGSRTHVLLILRSWLAQDVIDEEKCVEPWSGGAQAQAQEDGVGGLAASGMEWGHLDSAVPEIFRPCVDGSGEGRGIDGRGYGPGPLRLPERVAGQYRYALQHRVAWGGGGRGGRGGAGVLAALSPSAPSPSSFLTPLALPAVHSYDEAQPDLSCWRACRAYIHDSLPLALVRDAILAQLDLEAVKGEPPLPPHPLVSCTGHPIGRTIGAVQAFVVDADVLARGMSSADPLPLPHGQQVTGPGYNRLEKAAPARQWLRGVLGVMGGGGGADAVKGRQACLNKPIGKMLPDSSRRDGASGAAGVYVEPTGAWSCSAGSTSLSPTGLVWVDEDAMCTLVRGGSAEVGAGAGGSPRLVMHPALAAALCPFSVEHVSGDVKRDFAPPGSTLFEDGVLPNAYALSESLVWAGGGNSVRRRLWSGGGEGGPCIAHEMPQWPPWPVYPQPPPSPPLPLPLHHAWCPHLFPHRIGRHNSIVYHGTSPDMGARIAQEGFRRAQCRLLERCHAGACDDQMLGFGVYFGEAGKAREYAVKRAVFNAERGVACGAVISARVDLGHVRCASRTPCPCGCGQLFVDHFGGWYADVGADSLYLRDGSLPAARTREWAVADPMRVVVTAVQEVQADDVR